ncbi:hypothetical protein N566_17015 [Streptomycetaceae bacterium MP113-05]|nr:hypothetical protein N566_17015 [Streptomycetaceae bacterium MP113-05]
MALRCGSPGTRAERKADTELNAELKKVRGEVAMLLRTAEAALSEPSGTVRRVSYPVVGGEKTLKEQLVGLSMIRSRGRPSTMTSSAGAGRGSSTEPGA